MEENGGRAGGRKTKRTCRRMRRSLGVSILCEEVGQFYKRHMTSQMATTTLTASIATMEEKV